MTLADQLQVVEDDIAYLLWQQREAERADLEGREVNRADHMDAINRRAGELQRLHRVKAGLERELREQDDEQVAA